MNVRRCCALIALALALHARPVQAQCVYSLSATSASAPSFASTNSLSVTTGTSCSWTAVSNVSWVTITGGATGTGIGTVTYSVAANPTGSARTGTLMVAGQTYTITQAGNSCVYSLSNTSDSVPSFATTNSLSVTTGTSCSWTAVSNVSWVTITAGASGTGIGTVTYSVAANPTGSTRTGTLTIAGQTYTITQAANSCVYSLSATSTSAPSFATTNSLSVTTGTSCSWTAVSNVSWVTITAGASGTGIGTVTYSVAANPTGSTRTGTLTIAGQTYTITQAANSCVYSLSATSTSAPSFASTNSLSVTTGTSCSWTAVSNVSWITITAGASGTGIGTVTYSVAANSSGSARTGTLTVAGQTYTITQAANSCVYSLSSPSDSVPSFATTNSVSIISGTSCSWTAVSNVSWITITGGATGTGIGTVTYSVVANSSGSARTGTLTVAGQTYTITQ